LNGIGHVDDPNTQMPKYRCIGLIGHCVLILLSIKIFAKNQGNHIIAYKSKINKEKALKLEKYIENTRIISVKYIFITIDQINQKINDSTNIALLPSGTKFYHMFSYKI
jgi:hypothetical protein